MSITELLRPVSVPHLAGRLITPHDVGGYAGWQSLVHRGSLQPLYGEHAIASGTRETRTLRARSLSNSLALPKPATKQLVIAGETASWLLTGGDVPVNATLIYRHGRHRTNVPGAIMRASAFTQEHVCKVAGVWVTTLERTICDVAIWHPPTAALKLIRRLVAAGGDVASAEAILERRLRVVGRPAARQTLQAAQLACRQSSGGTAAV